MSLVIKFISTYLNSSLQLFQISIQNIINNSTFSNPKIIIILKNNILSSQLSLTSKCRLVHTRADFASKKDEVGTLKSSRSEDGKGPAES